MAEEQVTVSSSKRPPPLSALDHRPCRIFHLFDHITPHRTTRMDRTKINALLDWMRAGGARWADGVEVRHDDTYGWAPFTTTALDADEDIVTVPFDLVLTPQLSDAAFAGLLRRNDVDLTALEESSRLAGYMVLHQMAADRTRTDKLDWTVAPSVLKHTAYIESLPTSSLSPISYSPAELSLLAGTPLPSATAALLASWDNQYHALVAAVDLRAEDGFTPARFTQAMGLIASRSFPSRLLDSKAQDPLEDVAIVEGQEGLDHPILIPGYDLLNHRPLTPVSWVSTPPATARAGGGGGGGTVALVHHFPLGPGQQIFNNYGSKPSSSLLLSYGFALPLERQPEGMETLPLRLGGVPQDRQALCGRVGVEWDKPWDLCMIDGVVEPPTGLRRLLRVVVADAEEAAQVVADPKRLDVPLSGENELEALASLQDLLTAKLALLQQVAAAPPPSEARAAVIELCTVYRDNQILLLREAVAWTGREMVGVAREFGIEMDDQGEEEGSD